MTRGRPFPPGNNANPKGRPRGVKEPLPRGLAKQVVFEVIFENLPAFMTALRAAAISPKTALQFSELVAKLNREVGPTAGLGGGVTVNLRTNVEIGALKAAAVRAIPVAPPSEADRPAASRSRRARGGAKAEQRAR